MESSKANCEKATTPEPHRLNEVVPPSHFKASPAQLNTVSSQQNGDLNQGIPDHDPALITITLHHYTTLACSDYIFHL